MHFVRLHTSTEVREVIERLNSEGKPVAVDTETTGLNWRVDKLVSIVIGNTDNGWTFPPQLAGHLLGLVVPLVFQNFKFDYHFLLKAGIDLRSKPMRDIMLLDHLVSENSPDDPLGHTPASHSLDTMVKHHFGDDYKQKFWAKYDSVEEAPEQERLEYEAKDGIYTARLYHILMKTLLDRDALAQSHHNCDLINHVHRLALTLFNTEHAGIRIDIDYLAEKGVQLKEVIGKAQEGMRPLVEEECALIEMEEYEKELSQRKTAKGKANVKFPEFNFESIPQLKELLYNKLRLPTQYNRKRKVSMDDEALSQIEQKHPIVGAIRKYREANKTYGTYIEGILERQVDGRIYPTFNVNGTKTGRISHSDPNMGNFPKDGGIRGIFRPDEGHVFISADYGMLEVVIAAHYSQDKNLLKIINEGASKHDITAEALGIPRSAAKTINFALQYGAGARKVASILGRSLEEGQRAWDRYWQAYSGEKAVIDACTEQVNRGLPIINLFGRERHFPTAFNTEFDRQKAYRQAYSALVQGSGSELTSRALYLICERYRVNGWTVHDEVIVQVPSDTADIVKEAVVRIMKQVGTEAGLTVPLTVDASIMPTRWED